MSTKSPTYSLKHSCRIQTADYADFLTHSPYLKRFDKVCLRIRKLISIADTAESRAYFRSNAAMMKEKKRHMNTRKYRHIIHPLSTFLGYSKTLMFVFWLVVFIVDPFVGSFYAEEFLKGDIMDNLGVEIAVTSINVILLLYIVRNCFTGFIVERTKEVVLDQRRIIKNYLKGYFFIDFLPSATSTLFLVYNDFTYEQKLAIFTVKYLRLLRLKTMLRNFDDVLQRFSFGESFRTFAGVIIIAVLLVHWWACILALVYVYKKSLGFDLSQSWVQRQAIDKSTLHPDDIPDMTISHNYNFFLQMVLCHFYGAGVGFYETNDGMEMFVFAMILMSGLFFNVLTIAYLLQHFGTVNISEMKFDEFLTQAKQYMHTHDLPLKLRKQIYIYYNIKFQNRFFSEHYILAGLSEHLRMEVFLHSCRNLMNQVSLFRGLSRSAIGSMVALFQQEIFISKQEIMKSEEDQGTLHFIVNGTCMVKTVLGVEAMHIEDGDHFGEINLKETGSFLKVYYRIVALETVQIFSISKADLQYCCSMFPEIAKKMEELAKTRLKWHTTLMLVSSRIEYDPDDILGELSKGRIISPGVKRQFFIEPDQ